MSRLFLTLVIPLVLMGDVLAQKNSRLVQLEQGPVLGYKDPNGGLYSYVNIPYATAPTGKNRYKAPLPPPVWTKPYDASNKMIACLQPPALGITSLYPDLEVVEDCLIANIYVPDTTETNLPVLVFVHGGAYLTFFGQAFQFNSFVRSQNVIVVTFNYRLGVQGFLCLGTEDVPGNAGMKDQVALLRWVRKNIGNFGGNPDEVTVHGCSAGGGSVDFLTLSPMTNGLFDKAIVESAAVFGVAGPQSDPMENAKIYAKRLNFTDVDDLNALEEFYKTASNELLMSEGEFLASTQDISIRFAPCIEREQRSGEEMFLHDAPINYLKNSSYVKVPLLLGFSEMEGIFKIPNFDGYKNRMKNNFADFLPADLQFESEIQKNIVAAQVKEFYFGNQDITENTILSYVDYFTDVMFVSQMMRAANMRVLVGDTIFLYEYSFVDKNTPFVAHTNVRGADHCAQMNPILDSTLLPQDETEEFQRIQLQMREYWRNFIVTGNPTPEGSSLPSWPPVNGVNSPYMSLNTTVKLEGSPVRPEIIRFWDSIYEQYYRLPVPPA